MIRRKSGLANLSALLVRALDDRKATPGITESSPARAHIDPVACYLDVGSFHPGRAAAAKGEVVRLLKEIVSWLDRRETGRLLSVRGVLRSEGRLVLVREEQANGTSGLSAVWQGTPSSYVLSDKG